ncbi:MAG: DUF5807 family protein [Halodesulfurarchaeum sp.]|nr:DUF5807 family protein [Halodesulfurarchaeum sp.]
MNTSIDSFLAGEHPQHVAAYFSRETLSDAATLAEQAYAEAAGDGVRIVVPADAGRAAFESASGIDPMDFAGEAMGKAGTIATALTAGDCPRGEERDESGADGHDVQIVFAFAEEQNEEVGGLYAEGDVIHAYARCACGEMYADKWVAGEREL